MLDNKNKNVAIKIISLVFLLYLLVLYWFFFISLGTTDRNTYFIKREIHLIPFKNTYTNFESLHDIALIVPPDQFTYYQYLFIRNIIGNILLLIPLGFMASLLFQQLKTLKAIVVFSILFSSLVESTQYVLKIGVFDIDDIIYNAIGTLTGFYILQIVRSLISKSSTKANKHSNK
jgi:glycopeptide antibiotics resistance protein